MEAKCKCGSTLFMDDVYDISEDEYNSVIIKRIVGHCEDCGAEYQWEEVYTFTTVRDVEEMSEQTEGE